MKDKDIIVIPFNVLWNWSADYANQTAFELAKKGNTVICYLWGDEKSLKEFLVTNKYPKLITKYSINIYLFNPIYFVPFRRFKFIGNLNSSINLLFLRLFTELVSIFKKTKKKIFWIFNPNLVYLYKYFGKKYFLLYDSVDFYTIGDKKHVLETRINERYLCKTADLVVANSHVLRDYLSKYKSDVKLVPQGFRISDFQRRKYKIIDLNLKKPVIGFVGTVNARLDYDLLLNLARRNPNWNFVIWGPILEKEKINQETWNKMQKLFSLSNVKTGKSGDKKEIPGIISQFDIGMIPYDISQDFNKLCYPMKLFEYFYLGKPVVSTVIEELERFPKFVKMGKNASEWEKIIHKLLSNKWSKAYKIEQRKLAEENSWERKIHEVIQDIPQRFIFQ